MATADRCSDRVHLASGEKTEQDISNKAPAEEAAYPTEHTHLNLFGHSQFSILSFVNVHKIPFVESFPVEVVFSFVNHDAPAATQCVSAGSADRQVFVCCC